MPPLNPSVLWPSAVFLDDTPQLVNIGLEQTPELSTSFGWRSLCVFG